MIEYNIEHIEKLRIHELRDFARSMGVQSPTTMKKKDLISRINSLLKNENGNPLKTFKNSKTDDVIDFFSLLTSNNSSVLDDLIAQSLKKEEKKNQKEDASKTLIVKKKPIVAGDDNMYYPADEFYGVNLKLKQDYATYDNPYEIFGGYVDIHPSGYGIVRRNGFVPGDQDIYLAKPWVIKHKIKKGYFVQGKVKEVIDNKPKVMYEIISIDGNKDAKKTKLYEDFDYNGIGSTFYFDKFALNVNKGSRTYINSASLQDSVKLGYDIVEENSASVKLINIKSRPEEEYKSDQKLEIINCPFNKTEVEIVNAVELVVERIKREFEYGTSNVLIIYNFSELIRIFNAAIEGFYDFQKFNIKATNKISNILYLAKHVNEKLNVSIICIDKNGVPEDLKQIMNSEYIQIFNQLLEKLQSK